MIMEGKAKLVWLILVMLYVISPVDFFPGPVDDILVALLYAGFQARQRLVA